MSATTCEAQRKVSLYSALASCPLALCLVFAAFAYAQFPEAPQVPAAMVDAAALKPPAGVNVAIVEFADLECPACAAANPSLVATAARYHVPIVRHDLLIPGHVWSPQAAVDARWFDTKSPRLGEDYRSTIFAEQQSIATLDDLVQATQKFAQQHGVALPFVIDPQGKFAEQISQDRELGHALGVSRTPTVFVVTAHSHTAGHPFVQLKDLQMLSVYLDQAISATSAQKALGAGAHKAKAS